jgi:N-acetylneuraminate lyase
MRTKTIGGLIPAPHTPMDSSGRLDTSVVARQVDRFLATGVQGAFVGGTTGECLSLSVNERLELAEAWIALARHTPLAVIIQVGGNCVSECEMLAERAEQLGADAIAALAPTFFRPSSIDPLLDYCRRIAARAPATPFYFYDIPSMTGVRLPTTQLVERACRELPTFQGLKYSNDDLVQLQQCLAIAPERLRILFGFDELLLPALSLGVHGAVGATYNFVAPLYLQMMAAFERGELVLARELQRRSVRLVQTLRQYGFMASAKATMEFTGLDCGPVRPPLTPLDASDKERLRRELEANGFLDICRGT